MDQTRSTYPADRHEARWWALLTRDWEEPGDLDATLNRIAETAKQVFEADLCVIFTVNPVTRRLAPIPRVAGELEKQDGTSHLEPPHEIGLLGQVIKEKIFLVENTASLPEGQATFSRRQKVCSFAGIVLQTTRQHHPVAVLYVNYRRRQTFGQVDREDLLRFAELASHKLEVTWFLRRYQQVGQIGAKINLGIKTEKQLFRELCKCARRIINIEHCFLLALDRQVGNKIDLFTLIDGSEGSELGLVAGQRQLRLIQSAEPLVIMSREGVPTERMRDVESLPGWLPWQAASAIVVPLRLDGRLLGILSVRHRHPQAYNNDDSHLLAFLGKHAALALSNQRLFGNLHRLQNVGRTLIQNLESRDVLGAVVDAIRETTGCDLAVLYSYVQTTESFEFPPTYSGKLRQGELPQTLSSELRADFVVRQSTSLFEEDARQLFTRVDDSSGKRTDSFRQREEICSVAALPLRVGEEVVGALFVNYRTSQRLSDPSQQQLLEGLASYAAIAIKNARTFGAEQSRYLKNLETLRSLDREISCCDDLDDLLMAILEFIVDRLAEDHKVPDKASILLYDESQEALVTRAAVGAHSEKTEARSASGDDLAISLEVFRTKRSILIGDVPASKWEDLYLGVGGQTRCELDVPLVDGRAVLGILHLESRQRAAFDSSDLRFMETLAGQAVLAVRQAQAREQERRLRKDQETLIELGKELTRRLDVQGLLDLIVRRAIENTNADNGVLLLVHPQDGDLVVKAELGVAEGVLGRRLSRDIGISGLAVREGHLVNADLTKSPWNDLHVPASPLTQSQLAVPLMRDGEVIGALSLESSKKRFFSIYNERLLTALADLAVIALQNAERFEKSERRQRKLRALDELGRRLIAQIEDPHQVMQAIAHHARVLTKATISNLDLYEDGRWVNAYRDQAGSAGTENWDLRKSEHRKSPDGIRQHVGETCQSLLVEGDAAEHPNYEGPAEIHSELAVPLQNRQGELLGVLDVTSTQLGAFGEEDRELLNLFAAQAVIAIENSRNYKAAKQRLKLFELLLRAGKELAQITDFSDLPKAYKLVVRTAEAQCQSHVVLRRFDELTRELVVVASDRRKGPEHFPRIPVDDNLNGRAARERRTLVFDDAEKPPPDIGGFDRSNPKDRAFVVTPILFETAYYGNLALSHEKPKHFRTEDVKLLQGLAQQLAITIHRLGEVEAYRTAEKRAKEAEAIGEVGRQTYEIMHRLGNDLGLVPKWVRKIRTSAPIDSPATERLFEKVLRKVETVLDFSRNLGDALSNQLSSKREPPKVAPTPVRLLLDDAVSGLQLGDEDTIQVEMYVADDVGSVAVNHIQMVGALSNLITNSRQAMPDGGTLTLKAERAGDNVVLQIRDTGCGITEREIDRIFDLGFTTSRGGSGFGLWSTRNIVSSYGGTITVVSKCGEGSTFTILLPRALREISEVMESPSLEIPGNCAPRGQLVDSERSPILGHRNATGKEFRRSLVVEDDCDWQESVGDILQSENYEVESASSKQEAERKLASTSYDLIVLDLKLSKNDPANKEGMDILRNLPSSGPQRPRVIILSGTEIADQDPVLLWQHGIEKAIRKQDFDQDFRDEVRRLDSDPEFRDEVRRLDKRLTINLNLELNWQTGFGSADAVLGLWVGSTRVRTGSELQASLASNLELLLRGLFSDARSLMIKRLRQGKSGAGVLWVHPFSERAAGGPVIVKFGSQIQIDQEVQNFERYIKPHLQRITTIQNSRRVERLGGVVYSLVGAGEDFQSFAEFYKKSSSRAVEDALLDLFRKTCGRWYESSGQSEPVDLNSHYFEWLNMTPKRLARDLQFLKSVKGQGELCFDKLSADRSFRNPLRFLGHGDLTFATYQSLTHGDFNASNILVDPHTQCWLIDFGRSGRGHLLRDAIELDTVIRFSLIGPNEASLDERLALEEALCKAESFRQLEELEDVPPTSNPAVIKAYRVSKFLRQLAGELVALHVDIDIREFYAGAMLCALNTLRFRDLAEIQREHALLSACVMAKYLDA